MPNNYRSKVGFLRQKYAAIRGRVMGWSGSSRTKKSLLGCKLKFDLDEFINFGLSSAEFHRLFAIWESSGYQPRMSPSPSRIDKDLHFSLDNIEWVPHKESCHAYS